MHPLLTRQLRKAFGGQVPPELEIFVRMIDEAYAAADEDRRQLERSLHLASDELYERNRRLELQLEERKRLQVELQHAEKLRAVGQLAAGVAHEINTPVQFIRDSLSFLGDAFGEVEQLLAAVLDATPGGADLESLAQRLDIPFARAEIPRALALCRGGTDRVAAIVRALRVHARPDGDTPEPADLHAAIETTLIVVAGEVKHVADLDLRLTATRSVRCHIGEIQQVLLNLIVNAAHAIAERHGNSGVRGTIGVRTWDDGDDVRIAISDTGVGIPADLRDRIFEPFFTTKPIGKGSGQGLPIARALIVEHHGGELSFTSTPGQGTTFEIRLPVAGRPARAPAGK